MVCVCMRLCLSTDEGAVTVYEWSLTYPCTLFSSYIAELKSEFEDVAGI